MAITIPLVPLEPEEHDEQEHDEHALPSGPFVPLRVIPGTAGGPAGTESDFVAGTDGRHRVPQWPEAGWALEPHATARPQRSKAPGFGATGAVVISCLAVLGGLFTWAAYGGFAGQSSHAWDVAPQGQSYYQPPVRPLLPATATAAKLPPMMVTTPATTVTLKVDAPPLGGMYGGTGNVQDAFSPAYFSVPAGKTVHVTVVNYDPAWHTFTSPALGLNAWIPPSGSHPSKVSFSFKAPKAGYYWWLCNLPCDSYSMQSGGYMQGEIHVVKA